MRIPRMREKKWGSEISNSCILECNSYMTMEGQVIGMPHSDSQPWLLVTVRRPISKKSDRMTWHSEWMPRREKFSEKSFQALSSWNCTWEGVELKEVNALEQRRFWNGVDSHLGAIEQTNAREREREREKERCRKAPTISISI